MPWAQGTYSKVSPDWTKQPLISLNYALTYPKYSAPSKESTFSEILILAVTLILAYRNYANKMQDLI